MTNFPIGHTANQRRFRIDALLLGEGAERFFLGTELSTGKSVLVSVHVKPSNVNVVAFRAEMAFREPGLLDLEYIGTVDFVAGDDLGDQYEHWVMVERMPDEGAWLPSFLGTDPEWRYNPVSRKRPGFDRATSIEDALSLGISMGRMIQGASRVRPSIHPEMMWAKRVGGELVATGYTVRPPTFFRQIQLDAFTLPLFDRHYQAPEGGLNSDEKALVYSLSVMIAEWATGRFPFRYKDTRFHPHTGKPLPLKLPPPLQKLLLSGLRQQPKERPSLASFLETLDAIKNSSGGDAPAHGSSIPARLTSWLKSRKS